MNPYQTPEYLGEYRRSRDPVAVAVAVLLFSLRVVVGLVVAAVVAAVLAPLLAVFSVGIVVWGAYVTHRDALRGDREAVYVALFIDIALAVEFGAAVFVQSPAFPRVVRAVWTAAAS